MIFYLGTHKPNWLAKTAVPLFVSDVTLRKVKKKFPRALGPWALDSGGFTELSKHGTWTVLPEDYVARVRRYREEIGGLQWAAIQDWMCEEVILKKTGLSVIQHQLLTVTSYLQLKALAPEIPWAPVIQGWCHGDYLDCVELYARYGVDLTKEPVVGVGSVCRRQATLRAAIMLSHLADHGIKIHAFGFKLDGLKREPGLTCAADHIISSDSLAWSFHARKRPPLPGHSHKNCANCLPYALQWRERVIEGLEPQPVVEPRRRPIQASFFWSER